MILKGAFDNLVKVSGVLEFEGFQMDKQIKKYNINFQTHVFLYNMFLPGALLPPSYGYETKFEVEGNNYYRQVPISHVLQPGEADRFVITIGMDKSSRHIFKIRILYNNDETICFDKSVDMLTFVPKSIKMYSEFGDVIY